MPSGMNSRDRVLTALNHEEPDRVPTDFWVSKGFRQKLEKALGITLGEFLDRRDVDLRYIEGPRYIGPELRSFDGDITEDIWGVRRSVVKVPVKDGFEYYSELAQSPLSRVDTVGEIMEYAHWPSPDWFDYSGIEDQCEVLRKQGRAVVFMGDRLNRIAQLKPAMYLRGVEEILTDLIVNPDIARAIFGRIREFYLEYARRIFEAANGKLDIVLTGDDFGSQNGPLVSPDTWVEFLGDGFAEYVALAKSHGLKVMHHTCGSVREIIPLMIERGLDVLQSIQPEALNMDPASLKSEFGGRLSFHGGISIQNTLPFGTPEDVRSEVSRVIDSLAGSGGYILCTSHNIQADTPVENVLALMQAYSEFGGR